MYAWWLQLTIPYCIGLPRWCSSQESVCQLRRYKKYGFNPWVWKISWSSKWLPTPVFLPGKFHGQRSLAGYSPWCHKEQDRTEHACRRRRMRINYVSIKLERKKNYSYETQHPGCFSYQKHSVKPELKYEMKSETIRSQKVISRKRISPVKLTGSNLSNHLCLLLKHHLNDSSSFSFKI